MKVEILSMTEKEATSWLESDNVILEGLPQACGCRYGWYYLIDNRLNHKFLRYANKKKRPLVIFIQQLNLLEMPSVIWPEISFKWGYQSQLTLVLIGGTPLRRYVAWQNYFDFVTEGTPSFLKIVSYALTLFIFARPGGILQVINSKLSRVKK